MPPNFFGTLDLGAKYGIVFSGLFIVIVFLGVGKLWYNKRKIKKLLTKQSETTRDDESASANAELTLRNQRDLEGADLFGVRAIECGYYGGIPQSRPTTPSPSCSGGSVFRIPYGRPSQTQDSISVDYGAVPSVSRSGPAINEQATIQNIGPLPTQMLASLSSGTSNSVPSPGLDNSNLHRPNAGSESGMQILAPARRSPHVSSAVKNPYRYQSGTSDEFRRLHGSESLPSLSEVDEPSPLEQTQSPLPTPTSPDSTMEKMSSAEERFRDSTCPSIEASSVSSIELEDSNATTPRQNTRAEVIISTDCTDTVKRNLYNISCSTDWPFAPEPFTAVPLPVAC